MATRIRPERVGQEIQAAVADMLTRGDIHDPRIGYITITGVKVSPDLRVARIYYSMIGSEEEKARTQQGLDAAKGYVRREVTSRVKLRVSPEVFFTFDGSLEEGDKIERLIKEVKAKEGW
ncbi:MAG: 30S ribosome-binding factor RbfA [Myxococcaceae bacterium]|nr:30S ribosome-binding factor RbfA [Myxococcaceae bacterium]